MCNRDLHCSRAVAHPSWQTKQSIRAFQLNRRVPRATGGLTASVMENWRWQQAPRATHRTMSKRSDSVVPRADWVFSRAATVRERCQSASENRSLTVAARIVKRSSIPRQNIRTPNDRAYRSVAFDGSWTTIHGARLDLQSPGRMKTANGDKNIVDAWTAPSPYTDKGRPSALTPLLLRKPPPRSPGI